MAIVGIIGDTHIPYELEGYLDFCQNVFAAYGVDTVVHIGDLIDHSIGKVLDLFDIEHHLFKRWSGLPDGKQ